ncbi:hypothetical protein AX16_010113 [Volvariella volvacea WC 439]|nr:hypothetical protein AX16_010113 [Volvariella volvacea WC 439]
MFLREHRHWAYVWIPLFGAGVWFATLLTLIIVWAANGHPRYPSQEGSIAYISDVGATNLKPLFVTGCSITAASFVLSLFIERWLRHSGRLLPNMRRREVVLSWLSILGSIIGGAGLILLSVFDTRRFESLHRVFLLVFIIGVVLSAVFTIVEYRWISRDFHGVRELKIAYFVKAIIAGILIGLAIGFGIALYKGRNAGAVLEWIIGFGFTFYILTFVYDLRQSKGAIKHTYNRDRIEPHPTRPNAYALRELPPRVVE